MFYQHDWTPPPAPDTLQRQLLHERSSCGVHAQEEMGRWPDLQYCKTDLIAAKGVVFCKFARSSSALRALEAVTENGMVRLLYWVLERCSLRICFFVAILQP